MLSILSNSAAWLASLIALLVVPGHAKDCFIGGVYHPTTISAYADLQMCSTASAFCERNRVGQSYKKTVKIFTVRTIPTQPLSGIFSFTSTVVKNSFIGTTTVKESLATLTKAPTTTTLYQCSTVQTCGAVTFSNTLELSQACNCFLRETHTVTSTTRTSYSTRTILTTETTKVTKTATTTPTTTISRSTATQAVCSTLPKPKANCKNQGIQWAYYPLQPGDSPSNDYDNLADWDPAIYKSRTPNITGTIKSFTRITANYYAPRMEDVYNYSLPLNYLVVNHRAYFYAPQNGTYIFHIPSVRTVGLIWVGDLAYSGWNRSNALLDVTNAPQFSTGPPGKYATIELAAGNYYPIRLVWGLGKFLESQYPDEQLCGQCGEFYFNLYRPDGKFIEGVASSEHYYEDYKYDLSYDSGTTFAKSPCVVQFSCDGNSAPKYPPFGEET